MMLDAGCWMLDAGYEIRDARLVMRDAGLRGTGVNSDRKNEDIKKNPH
jgi:hypothetical protein